MCHNFIFLYNWETGGSLEAVYSINRPTFLTEVCILYRMDLTHVYKRRCAIQPGCLAEPWWQDTAAETRVGTRKGGDKTEKFHQL